MGYLSELKLPLLGETMESGRITEWCIKPGDDFERGQVLLEVETDKTIVEVPALQQGKLVEIVAEAGAQVTVGAVIAQIELVGEAPAAATTPSSAPIASAATPVRPVPPASPSFVSAMTRTAAATDNKRQQNQAGQRLFITPRARRTASHFGMDERTVIGTGRRHRITHADVVQAAAAVSSGPTVIDVTSDVIDTPMGQIHRTHWVPRAEDTTMTVVFIHGLFGDSQVWAEVASNLVNSQSGLSGMKVAACAVDLPGHGNSQNSASTYEQVSAAIVHAVQDFDQIVLVGHSYGGAVAVTVASQLQHKVLSLMLVAPLGLGSEVDQHFLDAMSSSTSDETQLADVLASLTASGKSPTTDFVRVLGQRLRDNSSQLQAMVRDVAHNGTQTIDAQKVLDAIECPVSVVWGRDDRIIDWRCCLQALENCNMTLLANTGHMPHMEQSRQFSGLVELFIQGAFSIS